jgi:hypothetical protein
MFIWRGWGVLVLFTVFLTSLAANLATNILAGRDYRNTHAWPLASALIVAGGLIWMTDFYFFRKAARVLVDEKTGERVTLASRNDFFFITMKWWGLISAGAGILIPGHEYCARPLDPVHAVRLRPHPAFGVVTPSNRKRPTGG